MHRPVSIVSLIKSFLRLINVSKYIEIHQTPYKYIDSFCSNLDLANSNKEQSYRGVGIVFVLTREMNYIIWLAACVFL